MYLYFLGICGMFMGSLVLLVKVQGYWVIGFDVNVYLSMSIQLEEQGIELIEGYDFVQLDLVLDLVIVGNVMLCGNEVVEYMLNWGLFYVFGL